MTAFDPDWCLSPGVILKECIPEGVSPRIFAHLARLDEQFVKDLLDCKPSAIIDDEIAHRIQYALASMGATPSAQFWINLEHFYRDGLARGKTDVS